MKIAIIGTGINGLVCANYLQRAGHEVIVLEKKLTPGGACCKATTTINGKTYEYPSGASVFGLMQDFIFEETGLAKEIKLQLPAEQDLIHFPEVTCAYPSEVAVKWGEHGLEAYMEDLAKVTKFFRENIKIGKIPFDMSPLGELYELWVSGSANNLFAHYFTSDYAKRFHAIPVTESGPVSLAEPFSAFNVVLMNSGSVCNGAWGFPKDGIWSITEKLVEINRGLGVQFIYGVDILSINEGVIICDKGALLADEIIFATDPLTASTLSRVTLTPKRYLGDSAKQIFFFDREVPVYNFHFIFNETGYLELYPEGPNRRLAGWKSNYDYITVFFKEGMPVEELVRPIIGDWVGSVLLTSKDLKEQFYFPGGNIDHMELCSGQTLWDRTFSNTGRFYQFGKNYWYCGAGAFPCGSVAGTCGYLCAKEVIDALRSSI